MSMKVEVTTKDGEKHTIDTADHIETIGSFLVCAGDKDSIWVPVSDIVLVTTQNNS